MKSTGKTKENADIRGCKKQSSAQKRNDWQLQATSDEGRTARHHVIRKDLSLLRLALLIISLALLIVSLAFTLLAGDKLAKDICIAIIAFSVTGLLFDVVIVVLLDLGLLRLWSSLLLYRRFVSRLGDFALGCWSLRDSGFAGTGGAASLARGTGRLWCLDGDARALSSGTTEGKVVLLLEDGDLVRDGTGIRVSESFGDLLVVNLGDVSGRNGSK
jgi:hypothetical protein